MRFVRQKPIKHLTVKKTRFHYFKRRAFMLRADEWTTNSLSKNIEVAPAVVKLEVHSNF
jgi:hypothetical protein